MNALHFLKRKPIHLCIITNDPFKKFHLILNNFVLVIKVSNTLYLIKISTLFPGEFISRNSERLMRERECLIPSDKKKLLKNLQSIEILVRVWFVKYQQNATI